MASTISFVNYITDQIDGAYFKRMFGEYGIYLDVKMVFLVCDDTLFIKPSPAISAIIKTNTMAPPYDGAKEYYVIEELDNREYLNLLAQTKFSELPLKTKKAK